MNFNNKTDFNNIPLYDSIIIRTIETTYRETVLFSKRLSPITEINNCEINKNIIKIYVY